MKIFLICHVKAGAKPDDLQPLAGPEDKITFELYRDDVVREVYSRADGPGAIGVLEC